MPEQEMDDVLFCMTDAEVLDWAAVNLPEHAALAEGRISINACMAQMVRTQVLLRKQMLATLLETPPAPETGLGDAIRILGGSPTDPGNPKEDPDPHTEIRGDIPVTQSLPCAEMEPQPYMHEKGPLQCTRAPGHPGDHQAWGEKNGFIKSWAQTKEDTTDV